MARALGGMGLGLLLLLGAGCRKKNDQVAPASREGSAMDAATTNDGGVTMAALGTGARLGFTITAVYENQQPSTASPFHAAGGDWTFFDAVASGGATFGFGFSKPSTGQFASAKALLFASDREQGKKLVALFAASFSSKPPPEKSPEPLAPAAVGMTILGKDMRREEGAYSGGGGSWYATKLYLQRTGIDAELFFNFSVAEKRGEFSEKDPDYANDMLEYLAIELRDGPRPPRTAATDPGITEHGPQIEWTRVITGNPYGMCPRRDAYWLIEPTDAGTRLVSTPFDKDARTELLRVPHELGLVRCNESLTLCLVEDVTRADPAGGAGHETKQLLLVDRKSHTTTALKPPWAVPAALHTDARMAADGSAAIMRATFDAPSDAKRNGVYVVDPDGSVRGPVAGTEDGSFNVQALSGTGSTLRATLEAQKRKRGTKDRTIRRLLLDPKTLATTLTESTVAEDSISPFADATSPDGKRIAKSADGKVVVRDLATGKELVIDVHEDDRKACEKDGCVRWASDRYLEYSATVRGFLDTEMRKLNVVAAFGDAGACEYSRDFKWVVASGKERRVGQIVMR